MQSNGLFILIVNISATEGAEALGAADGGSGLAAFVCGDPAAAGTAGKWAASAVGAIFGAAGAAVKRTVGVGAISGAAGAAVKRTAGRAFDCVAGAALLVVGARLLPVAGATGRGCWPALSISAAT